MELNIGLLEILGDHIGEKVETLDLLEEKIIWVFKVLAHGLLQEIPGQTIKETILNLVQKKLCQKNF